MRFLVALFFLIIFFDLRVGASEETTVITVENMQSIVELTNIPLSENAYVWDLDFSPDNEWLTIIEANLSPTVGWTGRIRIWNLETFQEDQTIIYGDLNASSLAFSPNGAMLMIGSFLGEGYILDFETQTVIDTVAISTEQINATSFSPNGQFIGFAGATVPASPNNPRIFPDGLRTINIFETESMESLFSWRPPDEISNWGGGSTIAFSQDNQFVALGQSGNVVSVWNLETLEQLDYIGGGTGGVNDVLFYNENNLLLVAYGDGKFVVWSLETQEQLRIFEGSNGWFNQVMFTEDETLLITNDTNGEIVFINFETGEQVYSFPAHEGAISSLALNPDGTLLASGGADGTVRLWGIPNED